MSWILVGLIFFLVLWLVILLLKEKELRQKLSTLRVEVLEEAALVIKQKEKELRKDAVRRSHSVIKGKVAEQIAPYLPGFKYDPRDCRFLGSPVDFVVFDGLAAGRLNQVVFIEIKSGKYARLTHREREVKDILELKGAKYELIKTGQT